MAAVTKSSGQVSQEKLEKRLLKKPQTLVELSARTGIATKRLTLPISRLIKEGKCVAHPGRPPKYSKPTA